MNTKQINNASTLKQLKEVEDAWKEKIEKEIKTDDEILTIIESITNALYVEGKTRAIINDTNFIIGSKVAHLPIAVIDPETKERKVCTQKTTILIITNETRYELLRERYLPITVKADYDERYDSKANLRTAVDGWVRHVTGTIKPEMIE